METGTLFFPAKACTNSEGYLQWILRIISPDGRQHHLFPSRSDYQELAREMMDMWNPDNRTVLITGGIESRTLLHKVAPLFEIVVLRLPEDHTAVQAGGFRYEGVSTDIIVSIINNMDPPEPLRITPDILGGEGVTALAEDLRDVSVRLPLFQGRLSESQEGEIFFDTRGLAFGGEIRSTNEQWLFPED